MNEIVYLVKQDIAVGVSSKYGSRLKLGRSSNICVNEGSHRLKQYGSKAEFFCILRCYNSEELENKLKDIFTENFQKGPRNEYFDGDEDKMYQLFVETVMKENKKEDSEDESEDEVDEVEVEEVEGEDEDKKDKPNRGPRSRCFIITIDERDPIFIEDIRDTLDFLKCDKLYVGSDYNVDTNFFKGVILFKNPRYLSSVQEMLGEPFKVEVNNNFHRTLRELRRDYDVYRSKGITVNDI